MIYYTHVNEGNAAERAAFRARQYCRLLCVAGSGERLIALLDKPNLRYVHAIDPNKEALYLLELKLTALEILPVEEYLQFIGFWESTAVKRIDWFDKLKGKLSPACLMFWGNHLAEIKRGVCNAGHFERFLARGRPLLHLFLGKNFFRSFSQDIDFYERFPHIRWRLVKWLFSKKWVYKFLGNRDIAFVGRGCRTSIIPKALQKLLDENRLNESFMAHLIFNGHLRDMQPDAMPPSLQPGVLAAVQKALRGRAFRLEYHRTDFLDFLKNYPLPEQEDIFCSFSDVLSFEPPSYLLDCLSILKNKTKHTGLVARTFLKNELTENDLLQIRSMGFRVVEISSLDKTAMYRVFKIEN